MKKPRVDRFDPKNRKPEEIDLSGIPSIASHQRSGVKSRENKSTETPRPQPENQPSIDSKPYARTPVPPPARTPVRPYGVPAGKRVISRYAFEFFQDQIESLRKFSLDEKSAGEKGSMSEMVRIAVDAYIAKRNRTE